MHYDYLWLDSCSSFPSHRGIQHATSLASTDRHQEPSNCPLLCTLVWPYLDYSIHSSYHLVIHSATQLKLDSVPSTGLRKLMAESSLHFGCWVTPSKYCLTQCYWPWQASEQTFRNRCASRRFSHSTYSLAAFVATRLSECCLKMADCYDFLAIFPAEEFGLWLTRYAQVLAVHLLRHHLEHSYYTWRQFASMAVHKA